MLFHSDSWFSLFKQNFFDRFTFHWFDRAFRLIKIWHKIKVCTNCNIHKAFWCTMKFSNRPIFMISSFISSWLKSNRLFRWFIVHFDLSHLFFFLHTNVFPLQDFLSKLINCWFCSKYKFFESFTVFAFLNFFDFKWLWLSNVTWLIKWYLLRDSRPWLFWGQIRI